MQFFPVPVSNWPKNFKISSNPWLNSNKSKEFSNLTYFAILIFFFLSFSEQLARRLQEEENQQQEQPSPERSSASQPSRPSGSSSGRPTASANPPSTSTRTKNVRPTVIDLFRERIRIFLHRKNSN